LVFSDSKEMNIISKYKKIDIRKKVKLDVLLAFLISISALFLPFRSYFDPEGNQIKLDYGYQSTTLLVLFIYLIFSSFCLFSMERVYVRNANVIISILLFLNFIANNLFINIYVPYGPIAPQTRIGYWVPFFSIIYLMLKGFLFRKKFE
jgi:hypothetical protein